MGMGHMHAFITTVENVTWNKLNDTDIWTTVYRLVAQNSQYAASSQSSQNSPKIEK